MNYAVVLYSALILIAGAAMYVSASAFRHCKGCSSRRDHRPALLALIVSACWVIVGLNGVLVKYDTPWRSLTLDPATFALLGCFTLLALILFIRDTYIRTHCYDRN